mgnify:FL=1
MNLPNYRVRTLRTWKPSQNKSRLESINSKNELISLLDLASNDYLGLSSHPAILDAAFKTMRDEGIGSGGSRLLTGSRPIHQKLENAISDWISREHVLLFPSGFQANIAAVQTLADRHTTVFADKYIHNSLLVGVQASRAKLKRYSHNNLIELENYLRNSFQLSPGKSLLVITESLFSMEGTSPDIKAIAALCQKYNAKLLVDEAHSLGVLGDGGRGLCFGINESISIICGTFGKAFGSGGAFLASNNKIGNELIQTSGAFKYTTAIAPPLCAASLASLELIKENPKWMNELITNSFKWRKELASAGWITTEGNGPIIPLIVGKDQKALEIQEILEQEGFLCSAIRPPTVKEGTARMRIVIRLGLPSNTLPNFIHALNKS